MKFKPKSTFHFVGTSSSYWVSDCTQTGVLWSLSDSIKHNCKLNNPFFLLLLVCFQFKYCISVKIHKQIVSYSKIMKKRHNRWWICWSCNLVSLKPKDLSCWASLMHCSLKNRRLNIPKANKMHVLQWEDFFFLSVFLALALMQRAKARGGDQRKYTFEL